MKFKQPLQPAILVRRYKRFLADVELPHGEVITVHCPNSGSMLGCREPGIEVMISRSDNPGRKYPHTLEMVRPGNSWVGINTSLTNRLVCEGLENGIIQELDPISAIQAEIKTSAHTRLDFLISHNGRNTYLEVKNCTMAEEDTARFPDAVTKRGAKHLRELMSLKKEGHGAAVLFCIQRNDTSRFTPARDIDSIYAETLQQAHQQGVLILAYQAEVKTTAIEIVCSIPVILDSTSL